MKRTGGCSRLIGSKRTVTGKRLTCVILTGAMILPLASCKKKKAMYKPDMYSAGRVIEATDPYFNAQVHKVEIPLDTGKLVEGLSISDCEYTGECAIVSYTISYYIPEEIQKKAMSNAQTGEIMDTGIDDYFAQGTAIFDKEGKLIKEIGGNADVIYGVALDQDGNIHMLYYHYEPVVYDGNMTPEDWEKQSNGKTDNVRIDIFDREGNTIKTVIVDADSESWRGWDSSFKILENGNYTFSTNGKIHIFDPEGHLIRSLSDEDRLLQGDIIEQNGKHFVLSVKRDIENGNDYQIKEVDLQTGKLGVSIEANTLGSYSNIMVTKDGIFVNSYSGCFKYNIETMEMKEIFNWNDTDVDRALMKNIQCTPVSEDEILAVGHKSYSVDYPYLIHLTRAQTNPHAGKKLIVVAGEHLSDCRDLQSFASMYSADTENSARVVLFDYTEGLREDEGLGNIEQSIYFDTISGAGPDILVNMFDSIAFRSDAVMEDMNQYLDGEYGVDRIDYFDNIFRACETNGKLYHIPIRFSLEGLVVNADEVSNTVGWTYEEFEEASHQMPDQVSFLEGVLYNELLELMIGTSLPQFVDYTNKTVDFQNEDMKRILKMVKDFGVAKIPDDEGYYYMDKDFGREGRLEGDGDLTQEKFMEGMLAMRVVSVSSVYDISASKDICPAEVSFLGFPAKEKTAMAVKPNVTMGIVASSKSKGLAWEFIKAYMEKTSRNEYSEYVFSSKKSTFESDCQHIMEDRNLFYSSFATEPNIAKFLAHPVSDEDIYFVRELIKSATISTGGDPVIFNILCEEAGAYFAGDRTIEETLKNVQNRAILVVNEL
ncbi:MAG: extracellular solute-binding protein [Clostridiales bacterium]|nr:extracellular solute-binding protein [Clostridiales bacterium]